MRPPQRFVSAPLYSTVIQAVKGLERGRGNWCCRHDACLFAKQRCCCAGQRSEPMSKIYGLWLPAYREPNEQSPFSLCSSQVGGQICILILVISVPFLHRFSEQCSGLGEPSLTASAAATSTSVEHPPVASTKAAGCKTGHAPEEQSRCAPVV